MTLPSTVHSGRERDPRGCAAGSGSFCLFVKSAGEESTARCVEEPFHLREARLPRPLSGRLPIDGQ